MWSGVCFALNPKCVVSVVVAAVLDVVWLLSGVCLWVVWRLSGCGLGCVFDVIWRLHGFRRSGLLSVVVVGDVYWCRSGGA